MFFHCHLIGWSDDPNFDPRKAMRSAKAFSSELSVRSVVIKTIAETEGDMAYLGFYLSKPPLHGKRRVPSAKSRTGYKLMASSKGMRPELCMRVIEILSHFRIDDLVSGIGEGVAVRAAIFKDFRKWHRTGRDGILFEPKMEHQDFWNSIRASNGSKNYLPPKLII